jgi:hypothetical protein
MKSAAESLGVVPLAVHGFPAAVVFRQWLSAGNGTVLIVLLSHTL